MPRLSTRQPKPPASDVEMRSPGPWEGSEESGSDDSPRVQQPNLQTRMADESSEEEAESPKRVSAPRARAQLLAGRSVPRCANAHVLEHAAALQRAEHEKPSKRPRKE